MAERTDLKHSSRLVDLDSVESQFEADQTRYREARPFPHLVLDGLVDDDCCRRIGASEFADCPSDRWSYHRHYSQKTYARTSRSTFSPELNQLIDELGSPRFCSALSRLTGIDGLFLDMELEDGGLACSPRGSFLLLHRDILVHPVHRYWLRRVNLILYLNEGWKESYKGALELWDSKLLACEQRVEALLGRMIVFDVGAKSYHGFPDLIECPPDMKRKSLNVYYFTEQSEKPRTRYFEYHARPGERRAALLVAIDNWLLRIYERLRPFGIGDALVNRIMRLLGTR